VRILPGKSPQQLIQAAGSGRDELSVRVNHAILLNGKERRVTVAAGQKKQTHIHSD
jgi:hypothetical protein